jgi:hypothetical protein
LQVARAALGAGSSSDVPPETSEVSPATNVRAVATRVMLFSDIDAISYAVRSIFAAEQTCWGDNPVSFMRKINEYWSNLWRSLTKRLEIKLSLSVD